MPKPKPLVATPAQQKLFTATKLSKADDMGDYDDEKSGIHFMLTDDNSNKESTFPGAIDESFTGPYSQFQDYSAFGVDTTALNNSHFNSLDDQLLQLGSGAPDTNDFLQGSFWTEPSASLGRLNLFDDALDSTGSSFPSLDIGDNASGSKNSKLVESTNQPVKEETRDDVDLSISQASDSEYEEEDLEGNSVPKAPKINKDGALRKPRQPRAKLLKWSDNDWKNVVLGLVWACGETGVQIPFEQAAQVVGPGCTAGALQQALLKLRAKQIAEGYQIPSLKMAWTRKNKNSSTTTSSADTNSAQILTPARVTLPRKKPTRQEGHQALIITIKRAYCESARAHLAIPHTFKQIIRNQQRVHAHTAVVDSVDKSSDEGLANYAFNPTPAVIPHVAQQHDSMMESARNSLDAILDLPLTFGVEIEGDLSSMITNTRGDTSHQLELPGNFQSQPGAYQVTALGAFTVMGQMSDAVRDKESGSFNSFNNVSSHADLNSHASLSSHANLNCLTNGNSLHNSYGVNGSTSFNNFNGVMSTSLFTPMPSRPPSPGKGMQFPTMANEHFKIDDDLFLLPNTNGSLGNFNGLGMHDGFGNSMELRAPTNNSAYTCSMRIPTPTTATFNRAYESLPGLSLRTAGVAVTGQNYPLLPFDDDVFIPQHLTGPVLPFPESNFEDLYSPVSGDMNMGFMSDATNQIYTPESKQDDLFTSLLDI